MEKYLALAKNYIWLKPTCVSFVPRPEGRGYFILMHNLSLFKELFGDKQQVPSSRQAQYVG